MSQPGRAVSPHCWDTGHGTGCSLALGEQEAPVTSPALKASPSSNAICSWLGGEALWQRGDFVPAAFVPCQELCCPAHGVQPRLCAAGLWLIQQHWELLGGRLPAQAVPSSSTSTAALCRALGVVQGSTEGVWAVGTYRGCLCNVTVTLAALPADTLLGLSFTSSGQVFPLPSEEPGAFFHLPFPATDREELLWETLMLHWNLLYPVLTDQSAG